MVSNSVPNQASVPPSALRIFGQLRVDQSVLCMLDWIYPAEKTLLRQELGASLPNQSKDALAE